MSAASPLAHAVEFVGAIMLVTYAGCKYAIKRVERIRRRSIAAIEERLGKVRDDNPVISLDSRR
jgi:hypothetical protein